jgi:hypothetical protein
MVANLHAETLRCQKLTGVKRAENAGDRFMDSLLRAGAAMTTPVMVDFAFDQIDKLRASLARAAERG